MNPTSNLSTVKVAKLFCVSPDTVRQWRQPRFANSPRRLVGQQTAPNRYEYTLDQLDEFCKRNPVFYERLARSQYQTQLQG